MAKKGTTVIIEKYTPKNVWLSGADVKLMLNISESTLRRMRKNREIAHAKIGKTVFYPSLFFDKTLLLEASKTYDAPEG